MPTLRRNDNDNETETKNKTSAYDDKLPYSVQQFNSFADGKEVLTEEECWDLMESLDTDKNRELSIQEFSGSERYYDDLSFWGINGFRSKLNLRKVQQDILYKTKGKLPQKIVW